MISKFPDVIYAVADGLGGLLFFTDIKSCPIRFDDRIEIRIYHCGDRKILKRSYEVLELSGSSKDTDVK